MTRHVCAAAASIVILLAGSLQAHHSISATFDLSRSVTISGTVMKLDWRNPHMELIVETRNDDGQVRSWVIQGASINVLQKQGITRQDFERAIGHPLIVEAHPAREGSRYDALAVRISFPDGRSAVTGQAASSSASPRWQIRSAPRTADGQATRIVVSG